MTRDELHAFLERIEVPSVLAYLGCTDRDEALEALEERMRWAAWHFRDDARGWEAAFLLNHGHALRELLDEGEDAWWDRTAHTSRPRRPERGKARDWQTMKAFMTPGVAPLRTNPPPNFDPDTTLDAPLDFPLGSKKKRFRSGRNLPREDDQGITLLPEAENTPAPPPLRDDEEDIEEVEEVEEVEEPAAESPAPPPDPFAARPEEDDFVGPEVPAIPAIDPEEHTDPIGFSAARLPPEPARGQAPEPPGEPVPITARQIGDDEPTDPSVNRPPIPPAEAPTQPPAPMTRGPDDRSSGQSVLVWALVSVIVVLLVALGGVAAIALSHLGQRQGEELAHDGARARTASAVVQPSTPAPRPAPVPGSLVGSIWEGKSAGIGLRLVLTASSGTEVQGTLLRLIEPEPQPIRVHGTFDRESGTLRLETPYPSLVLEGTVHDGVAAGTWAPRGEVTAWTLKRQ